MERFTSEEREVLIDMLERDLGNLSYEIGNTDSPDYRDVLKRKRDLMKVSLEKIKMDEDEKLGPVSRENHPIL